ncbi:MAG: ATP-dependent Clp protease proteolytic subunit [Hyphomicrobiales bacterium]
MRLKNQLIWLAMIGVVCFSVWYFYQNVIPRAGTVTVTYPDERPGMAVVEISGKIDAPMARTLRKEYRAMRPGVNTIAISLNSPGGSLREGRDIIEIINRMNRNHKVFTFVGSRKNCISMCVPVFLAAQQRVAAANSRWMFHAPVRVDAFTGEEVEGPAFERSITTNWFLDRYFNDGRVNPAWARNMRKQVVVGKEVWRTGRELQDEGSHIITTECNARRAAECA